jgi:tetratricopeptide (TPR) repeat protein
MAKEYLERDLRMATERGYDSHYARAELGRLATSVGDFPTAQAYLEHSLQRSRESNSVFKECVALGNFSWLAQFQNDYQGALAMCQQALGLAQAMEDHYLEFDVRIMLGNSLLGLGLVAEAGQAYQAALKVYQLPDPKSLSIEPLAGLARVALASGDLAQALEHVGAILAYLEDGGTVDGTLEPLQIYLTCYQVLYAAGDPRAERVLTTAHTLLQERAAKLPDESTRRMFLQNVPYHREIVAAWAETHVQL